jgi:hypothetical protein
MRDRKSIDHDGPTISYGWVVRRNVNYPRIRRLNDDRLGTFLDDLNLRA